MVLNEQELTAVENGDPVAMTVAGTDCIPIRRDDYLRTHLETDSGSWTLEEMNLLADEADEMISENQQR